MSTWVQQDRVTYSSGEFLFEGRVKGSVADSFSALCFGGHVHLHSELSLDFSRIRSAYSNAIVRIVVTCRLLRRDGHRVSVTLPTEPYLLRLFHNTNWAHSLDPEHFAERERITDRHVPLRTFLDSTSQSEVVNRTMDVVLSSTRLGPDLYSGFDWTLQEITDNVLCHAESEEGGLVQVVTTGPNVQIVLADLGRGIPATMRDERPELTEDRDAIELATHERVTSKPSTNQGNGLAGTRTIAVASGGSLSIVSGWASVWWSLSDGSQSRRLPCRHAGTIIDVNLGRNPFSARRALSFGGDDHQPEGHLELSYWDLNEDVYLIRLAQEPGGVASRTAGRALRMKLLNMLDTDAASVIVLDWKDIRIPSSSFADEALAKLRVEVGPEVFARRIRNTNHSEGVTWTIQTALAKRS